VRRLQPACAVQVRVGLAAREDRVDPGARVGPWRSKWRKSRP